MGNSFITYIIFCIVILVQHNYTTAQETSTKSTKTCKGYGYQVWLSCITNPCLFASCPAFGKLAECRKEISDDCKTCRAAFYLNGRRVNCHLRNFECPPGLPLQQCVTDPCASTECIDSRFKGAQCRGYYCGGCFAEYFVDGEWKQCPNAEVKLQGDAPLLLPEIRRAMRDFSSDPQRRANVATTQDTCEDGSPEPQCPEDTCQRAECPQFSRATCVVNKCQGCKPEFYFRGQLVNCQSTKCKQNVLEMSCPDDPCKYAKCPLYPGAECRPSNCGFCHPEWFVNDKEVNCFSRMPDNYQCPNGLQQQQCPRNTCRFKRCLKDVDTYCRVNNCGGCYAEYVNTQNEIVDCVGWWTKYENKKPNELLQPDASPAEVRTPTGTRSEVTLPEIGSNTAPEVKSSVVKQAEVDALFSELGLVVPPNSEIIMSPSSSQSVKVNNIAANPNSQNGPVQMTNSATDLKTDAKGTIQGGSGFLKDKPVSAGQSQNIGVESLATNPIVTHTNIQVAQQSKNQVVQNNAVPDRQNGVGLGSQNINDPVLDSSSTPRRVTITDNANRGPPSSNPESTGWQTLSAQSPINLFRSLAIPLDALNANSNFIPGVPIGGWNFRSQNR